MYLIQPHPILKFNLNYSFVQKLDAHAASAFVGDAGPFVFVDSGSSTGFETGPVALWLVEKDKNKS
jgi:hypothetical protein